MNQQSGTKVLASGNLFLWKHEQVSGRGAVTGTFSGPVSNADVAEAKEFARSLKPEAARGVFEDVNFGEGGKRAHRDIAHDFLTGGSRN